MIKKYDKYKKCGIEWASEIPSDWEVKSLKNKIKYEKGINAALYTKEFIADNLGDIPVYSGQTANNGVMGFTNRIDYTLDVAILVTTVGAKAMTVRKVNGNFCLSQNCALLSSKQYDVCLDYFKYQLEILFECERGKIAEIMQPSLRFEDLDLYKIIFPSFVEQGKIAQYLDTQTATIEKLIHQKEKLIELLNEKRKAIINETVKKGLNPYAKMKNSGNEWLGDICVNWNKMKLKWISEIYAGGTPSTNDEKFWTNGTIPWLNSGTVNQKMITEASAFITEDAVKNSSTRWVPKNSLLMALAGQGKTKGTVAVLGFDATCNQSMAAIVPNSNKINSEFLFFWLHSNYERIRGLAGSEQRDGLNLEIVGNIICPIPPLEEQKNIAKYLVDYELKYEYLNKEILNQIEKIKEYRQSLISEVVTGKIDVRDWQPKKH
jgi:type I restriction enzyme, S subunit